MSFKVCAVLARPKENKIEVIIPINSKRPTTSVTAP